MNSTDTNYPHLTVAAIVERNKRFLLVVEQDRGQQVLNQPAGHVECGESLQSAVVREVLEETGWNIEVQALLGTTMFHSPINDVYYYRTTFIAAADIQVYEAPPDKEISAVHWLTLDQIHAQSDKMRSPLVLKSIERYLQGVRYPLDFIY